MGTEAHARLALGLLVAIVVAEIVAVFMLVCRSITAYQTGYNDAIHSAELIEMDGSGYVIRFGRGDDFQVHEYAFAEVSK